MVPPWTPDPPTGEASGNGAEGGDAPADDGVAAPQVPPAPAPLAPPARFRGARRALGEFAKSGDGGDMRRSMGHYVRTGYGGSATATRRFGGTAATAGALGGALARVAAGQPAEPGSPLDPALLAGRNVQEVMNAVVEAVRPVDGTQDAEAERAAIRDALTELLTRFPDADLLNLDPEQRAFAIERFTAIDVFRRFELDVGKGSLRARSIWGAGSALARPCWPVTRGGHWRPRCHGTESLPRRMALSHRLMGERHGRGMQTER